MKVGIDIVNNNRLQSKINNSFLNLILSNRELEEYWSRNNKIQYLAGRIAAKEAVIKCLKNESITEMKEIVLLNNSNGDPFVNYKGYEIDVSISHEVDYTIAIAIIQE